MMQQYGMFPGWGGWGFGPIVMILFWLVVIALIVWAVSAFSSRAGSRPDQRPTPRQILDERFAKGEIDQDEYDRRRKALGA